MVNFGLIWELTKRDFTEQYAGSVLGALWAMIWPLVYLVIYIMIFGKLMGGHLPGESSIYTYGIYVTVGLVPWSAFSSTLNRSCSVFLEKKHIITKLSTSLPMLLVYVSLSETITFLITMTIFFVFLVATGYTFHSGLLLVPFIFYLMQLFAVGFGLLMATFTVFIRDLKQIVGIILQFWFWFTPIVYVPQILPRLHLRPIVSTVVCLPGRSALSATAAADGAGAWGPGLGLPGVSDPGKRREGFYLNACADSECLGRGLRRAGLWVAETVPLPAQRVWAFAVQHFDAARCVLDVSAAARLLGLLK